jgi:hypothetical protein
MGRFTLTSASPVTLEIKVGDKVRNLIEVEQQLRIQILSMDPKSPKELGIADDDRKVAVGLISLTLK